MAFDLQPRLSGTRIELRPLVPADFEALYVVASDPLIWEQHPERDRCERPVFQRYFDGGIESGGAFAILDRVTGAVIGSSRYCHLDPAGCQVEIGWTFLARAYWGGEYNRELKTLMLEHAFRFVERVVFVVGEHNRRSQRALEKVGARLVGSGPAEAPGARASDQVFAITRADWEKATPPRP